MDYYIFLDIDGVLNNEIHLIKCWNINGNHAMHMNHVPFDPHALELLMIMCNKIRENGNLHIILSSTWRLHDEDFAIVNARLAEYGLRCEDKTPVINHKRGIEIKEFLKNKNNYNFAILDDDIFDIKEVFPNNFVTIDRYCGLEWCDCKKVLKILKIN